MGPKRTIEGSDRGHFTAFDSEGSKTFFEFSFHVDLDHFRVIHVSLGAP